ncbi:iron ABC transporter [Thermocladium modestius]|uniref:Iron ABC transporter n=1 Tax=Thermocladium modestius TaxID=62609 RepID=A0A830GUE8_9CREN|nr:iron ABC transporter permease [Thermocladium modestius]GGP20428.1 iron ABC transporter [Thermocladium modestius]
MKALAASLAIAVLLSIPLNILVGTVKIPIGDILMPSGIYKVIIFDIRLPEALIGVIVGFILGATGAAFQSVFRNPLVDPFTIGNAGAAVLGALLAYLMILMHLLSSSFSLIAMPLFAFIFALATSLAVSYIGSHGGSLGLILVGVMFTLLTSSLIIIVEILISELNPSAIVQPLYVLYGDLNGVTWSTVFIITIASIIPLLALISYGRRLDLMLLGDDVVHASGLDPNRTRFIILTLASIPVATAMAFTGIIGFVGLVAPYVARYVEGRGSHAAVLPMSGIVGALMLSLSNAASRSISNYVIPITAVTGIVGIPLIVLMLYKGAYNVARI